MPPTIITKESLYKRITELERKHCCNKNQFFDTFAEFPAEGATNVLYIDKETQDIYIWDTLNEEYVLLNHTKTANTVYVDGTYGDDTTGQRESRDFPFQTLDAAIAVCETGDLLKVFPGDYTQTTTIQNLINIDCDNGVDWAFTGNFFNNTPDWTTDVTTTWTFDILRSTNTAPTLGQLNFGIKNTLGVHIINANLLKYIYRAGGNQAPIKEQYWNVKKMVNCYLISSSLSPVVDAISVVGIDYVERTQDTNPNLLIGAQMGNGAKLTTHIKNLKSINSSTGYGALPTIGYYFGSDAGTGKQYITTIDTITHDDPNIYVTPSGPLDGANTWTGTSVATQGGKLFVFGAGITQNTTSILNINNIKSTGHGGYIEGSANYSNTVVVINIKGVFEKGVPLWTTSMSSATNSKIILNLDLECHTSMGLVVGFDTGPSAWNNIGATNQIIVTGRIKTRYAGMSCISIGTGSGASNNTNGTILLKDLTLINDGTVSPIMCAVAENVLIQNVVTNSLVVDANITEVGQSIIRNVNYK